MKNLKPSHLHKSEDKIINSFNLSYCMSNTTLFLDNIKDKKVLVLGSGPSATEIDWINEDWDVLVTTSYFYLVPEILEQKPIHITLTNQINLKDERLINYLDDNPHCTIGFENIQFFHEGGWKAPFNNTTSQKYHDTFLLHSEFHNKYKDRIIYYQYLNINNSKKIGVGARVCYPVLMGNPKSLSMCGIDGISKNPKEDPPNYFRYRNDEKVPPMVFSWLAEGAESISERNLLKGKPIGDFMVNGAYQRTIGKLKDSYDSYKIDYEEFGENIYKIGLHHNIPIYNWGKGKPYNMITPISRKYE